MNEYVHIVSLTAPSPADYGGVFDLYHKIPALAAAGKNPILHYFDYRRERHAEGLESFCSRIYRYERAGAWRALLRNRSYIVDSRIHAGLIRRLNNDDHPVILEGIHCAGILPMLKPGRNVVLRLHNDEAVYYEQLMHTERRFLLKWYYGYEARRLKAFTESLDRNIHIAAVSSADSEVFSGIYGFRHVKFIPCFIPWKKVTTPTGRGDYCLYHGNMDIAENRAAAVFLLESVFRHVDIPLKIAGRNASRLREQTAIPGNVQIISDPDDHRISELIRHAHVNILPSMNRTGVKLKLIHALFEGRFCLTNQAGVQGSNLDDYVMTAETAGEFISSLQMLIHKDFGSGDLAQREKIRELYDNLENARLLSALL